MGHVATLVVPIAWTAATIHLVEVARVLPAVISALLIARMAATIHPVEEMEAVRVPVVVRVVVRNAQKLVSGIVVGPVLNAVMPLALLHAKTIAMKVVKGKTIVWYVIVPVHANIIVPIHAN